VEQANHDPLTTATPSITDRQAVTRIAPEEAGQRLDAWLADRFTYHSRSEWQRLIAEQRLAVNGRAERPAYRLRSGDEVRFEVGYLPEPPVSLAVRLCHVEPRFLAVDKPAPLPCHPAGPFFRHTLWHWLHERYGRIHLINRLDRETTGLVLVARDPATAAGFAAATIGKTYLVIVAGTFPETLDADGFLLPDETCEVRKKRRFVLHREAGEMPPAGGESARTRFRRLAGNAAWSLLAAELVTGRTHQIRATLRSLGFPVLGDKLYGPDPRLFLKAMTGTLDETDRAALILPHQALHAWRLVFPHPDTGAPVRLIASPPTPLREFCIANFGSVPSGENASMVGSGSS